MKYDYFTVSKDHKHRVFTKILLKIIESNWHWKKKDLIEINYSEDEADFIKVNSKDFAEFLDNFKFKS